MIDVHFIFTPYLHFAMSNTVISPNIPPAQTRLGNAEKGKVHRLLLRHAVADALGRVAHHLRGRGGAVAVDGLRPAGLGGVGGVLGGRQAKDVGPLLELLLVWTVSVQYTTQRHLLQTLTVLVIERVVARAVEAGQQLSVPVLVSLLGSTHI